jgi:hypothetical protein
VTLQCSMGDTADVWAVVHAALFPRRFHEKRQLTSNVTDFTINLLTKLTFKSNSVLDRTSATLVSRNCWVV